MAYSVWAEPPPGVLKDKLQSEIQRLATCHKAPVFAPHVTLVGGVWLPSKQDIISRATTAAKNLKKFTVRLSEPSSGSSYHRCVYILCEKDEPLLATAKALREALDVNPEAEYMPHLSLLYSSMSKDCREAIVAEEKTNLKAGGVAALPSAEFVVDSITVWHTPIGDSSCEVWERVAEIPLQA